MFNTKRLILNKQEYWEYLLKQFMRIDEQNWKSIIDKSEEWEVITYKTNKIDWILVCVYCNDRYSVTHIYVKK